MADLNNAVPAKNRSDVVHFVFVHVDPQSRRRGAPIRGGHHGVSPDSEAASRSSELHAQGKTNYVLSTLNDERPVYRQAP